MQRVRLGLHSFSYEYHFRHDPGFDAFAFVRRAADLGVGGVHISMNGFRFRCVGGTSAERLRAVGAAVRDAGMFLETDTSGTDPGHLADILEACRLLGADRVRTYTRHPGPPETQAEATIRDLRAAAPVAAEKGIMILLENHEDFTGDELRRILEAVDHASVGALYDFGNAMMVMEEPMEAAKAMAPFVRSVHLKDHVVVASDDPWAKGSPQAPFVYAVPIGQGRVDLEGILAYLLDATALERICIENSYGYAAPVRRHAERFPELSERSSTFGPLEGPFDEAVCLLDDRALAEADPARLLNYEDGAVALGVGKVREILGRLGFRAVTNTRGGVYVKEGQPAADSEAP